MLNSMVELELPNFLIFPSYFSRHADVIHQ